MRLGLGLVIAASLLLLQSTSALVGHIIAHSHCDPGWLETFEGYYKRQVSRILSGVVQHLRDDKDRRFVWSEISFFMRWFEEQSTETKADLRELVESGQFEFVGSGWVQNDEANPSYEAVVNQISEGHEYVASLFGVRPKIAWQIDPFGHSSDTPAIYASMGYDALVINRIHFAHKAALKKESQMEFVWQGPLNLPTAASDSAAPTQGSILTHVLHTHYSAPQGFDWENGGTPHINAGNVAYRANTLVSELKSRSNSYRSGHLLVPFGDDFKFQNARVQWQNMDQLVQHINQNTDRFGITLRYSTLSEYFDAMRASLTRALPVFAGDFFPYADNSRSYWTGYFTSRPGLKKLCREVDAALHAADTLLSLARTTSRTLQLPADDSWHGLYNLVKVSRHTAALVLHHDAITGTSRRTVAADYESRLRQAITDCHRVIATVGAAYMAADRTDTSGTASHAPLLAIPSRITVSETEGSEKEEWSIAVWNHLAWQRASAVRVEVAMFAPESRVAQPAFEVRDAAGELVKAQLQLLKRHHDLAAAPGLELVFVGLVPPLSIAVFTVTLVQTSTPSPSRQSILYSQPLVPKPTEPWTRWLTSSDAPTAPITLQGACGSVTLDPATGLISRASDINNAFDIEVSQSFMEYRTTQSGAYLFMATAHTRPSALLGNAKRSILVSRGDVLDEVTVTLQDAAWTVSVWKDIRMCRAGGNVLAGAFDLRVSAGSAINSEVVMRLGTGHSTEPKNAGVFYSATALRWIERPTERIENNIAARYFPLNAGAAISGKHNGEGPPMDVVVLSNQPLGVAACTIDGSAGKSCLEIMLHRQFRQDDGRGLSEPMRDPGLSTATFRVQFGGQGSVMPYWQAATAEFHHPVVTMSAAGSFRTALVQWQLPLAPGLHLLTCKPLDAVGDDILLRLQHTSVRKEAVQVPLTALESMSVVQLSGIASESFASTTPTSLSIQVSATETFAASGSSANEFVASLSGASQNTVEAGVFLSDAALQKAQEDAGKAAGRRLLAVPADASARHIAVLPQSVRTFRGPLKVKLLTSNVGGIASEVNGEPRDRPRTVQPKPLSGGSKSAQGSNPVTKPDPGAQVGSSEPAPEEAVPAVDAKPSSPLVVPDKPEGGAPVTKPGMQHEDAGTRPATNPAFAQDTGDLEPATKPAFGQENEADDMAKHPTQRIRSQAPSGVWADTVGSTPEDEWQSMRRKAGVRPVVAPRPKGLGWMLWLAPCALCSLAVCFRKNILGMFRSSQGSRRAMLDGPKAV